MQIDQRHVVGNLVLIGRVPGAMVSDLGIDRAFAAQRDPFVLPRQAMRAERLRRETEDFLAEAKKVMRFQPRFQIGEDGVKLYEQITQVSPEIVTFLKDFIGQRKQ